MSKRSNIIIYLLGLYVILQFLWWGYQIIDLGSLVDSSDNGSSRRVFMILGEGAVFIMILLAGFWQIQKSIRKEIELSESQKNFMLTVTHELKTPLTSIQLALQTLSSRKLSSDQTKSLVDKAISENDRLKILIDNIIHASSIENKGLTPDKSEIDLHEVLSQVGKKSNHRLEKDLVNLICEESIKVLVDKFMIETSIINIIENAIKYGGEHQIDVIARMRDNRCLISVADQGPGITENEQSHIFDKFYRIGNEETRMKKGSGLGLYIAKQFIELHNGNIQYKRNKPSGSIFTISIPNER